MEDNVVQMPSKLDRLAVRINDDLRKLKANDTERIAVTLDMCAALVEARDEFKDNKSFGSWFDASGIKLGPTDRAAAIAMGRDINRLKQILGATTSRSLQLIYEREFRLSSDRKTTSKPKGINVTPQLDKALKAYDRQKAAGKRPTNKSVATEAGVSEIPARKAATIRQVEAAAVEETILPKTWQDKMEAKLKLALTEAKAKLDIENRAKVEQWWAEVIESGFGDLLNRISKIEMAQRKDHPFTNKQYGKLLKVIHPDNVASKELRDEVFVLVKDREVRLRPDVETELRKDAEALRMRVMTIQQEKIMAWRATNGGRVRVPPEAMANIMKEATREAKDSG